MNISISTSYRFSGTIEEIISIYNQAIRPLIPNGPNDTDLLHIMQNQILYCSGTTDFHFSLQLIAIQGYELCIEINKPCAIVRTLEKLYSINTATYWKEVEQENQKFYANMA